MGGSFCQGQETRAFHPACTQKPRGPGCSQTPGLVPLAQSCLLKTLPEWFSLSQQGPRLHNNIWEPMPERLSRWLV